MTDLYMKNSSDERECIRPDSLTGVLFALEGIKGALVLLNGPMGCRFFHSTTSQFLKIRGPLKLPLTEGDPVPVDYNYLNHWFFRQPRIPCTALDGYDYVYGTREKVEEALDFIVREVDFSFLAVVNSPGAALIGDDLTYVTDLVEKRTGKVCFVIESGGLSGSFETGHDLAVRELLKACLPKMMDLPCEEKTVCLLGVSIYDRYWKGDLEEWERMLRLCGIRLHCAVGADNSMEDLIRIRKAALCVVTDPERGLESARFLKETAGIPYLVLPSLPVGFTAANTCLERICQELGADPAGFQKEIRKARAICYHSLDDFYQMCGLPSGAAFAVTGNTAQKKAFGSFLREYLEMTEASLEDAELVFSDANTIARLKLENRTFCGIEISNPGMGYTDILPKTQMGIQGAMFLTEQVLNGLMSRI